MIILQSDFKLHWFFFLYRVSQYINASSKEYILYYISYKVMILYIA